MNRLPPNPRLPEVTRSEADLRSMRHGVAHKDITQTIRALTDRVASARVVANAIIEGQQAQRTVMADQPLIKGLAEAVAAAKKSIAAARQAPVDLQTASAALVSTCQNLTKQVQAMHDDIQFEATQLGNSGAASTSATS